MRFSALFPSLARSVAFFTLMTLVLGGCAGGTTYTVDEHQLFNRFLPTVQSVSHHPDSLQALAIEASNGAIHYNMERSFQSLIEKWSCSRRYNRRNSPPRSHATFWSLELSLASLQPEVGILSLPKEKAYDLIEQRRKTYFDTIQIDVYWFQGNGIIAGPGIQVELHIADSTYRPAQKDYGLLQVTYLEGGLPGVNYRRNTFYFPRVVDGTDLLAGTEGMRLLVRQVGYGKSEFVWTWKENLSAHRRENQRTGAGL